MEFSEEVVPIVRISVYQNTGPGSNVNGRVKWAGYKPTLTVDDATKFTVESFIQGSEWLPDTE
ncbi:pectinesterase 3, partial [Quercus suber]